MVTLAASDARLARRPARFRPRPMATQRGERHRRPPRRHAPNPHNPARRDHAACRRQLPARGISRNLEHLPCQGARATRARGVPATARRASAIGAVREHILAILYGSGANGKSTLVGALQAALGDYAHAAPVSLLVGEQRGGATPDLADLRGRRFVTVAETREDGELSVERVKALTGGDKINARHLYGQPFTFTPSHTPWLLTNHKPRIGDDGDAIWRRLLLVPFLVTIPKDEQDVELADRLALEVDGILSWVVKGALEYGKRWPRPARTGDGSNCCLQDCRVDLLGLVRRTAPRSQKRLDVERRPALRLPGVGEGQRRRRTLSPCDQRAALAARPRSQSGTGGKRGWKNVAFKPKSGGE